MFAVLDPDSAETNAVAILESAYALRDPEMSVYLDRLAATIDSAFDPVGRSAVCVMWTFDASDPADVSLGEPRIVRGDPAVWSGMAQISATFDKNTVVRTYLSSHGLQTALATLDASNAEAAAMARAVYPRFGFRDMAALNVTDPSGKGCIVTWALPEEGRPVPRNASILWGRVAAHVAAGMRLRRSGETEIEAILGEGGEVVHAEGAASGNSALDALRHAVTIRERAAMPGADGVVEAWQGLVSGRWSLVDRFDADGRRVFLARRNDPREAKYTALTQLEINVARLAAVGHSNKLLAYELGVTESTISTALSRAITKLGVGSRSELVDLVWSFGGAHAIS